MVYKVLIGKDEERFTVSNPADLGEFLAESNRRIRELFRDAGKGVRCGEFRFTVHPDSAECDHELHGCAE